MKNLGNLLEVTQQNDYNKRKGGIDMDYALVRKIRDTVTGHDYFVSEVFAKFLTKHFAEMLDGKSFVVHFEGQPREVYLTTDMKFYLTSVGGHKQ